MIPLLSWKPFTAPLTIVQGKVDNAKATTILLYDVAEGRKKEYASTRLNGQYAFALAVPELKEGFYYVTDNFKRSYHRIYLKPGDQLQLKVTDTTLQQQGGSPESRLLREWETLSREIKAPAFEFMRGPGETYETFFPKFNAFLPKAVAFRKKLTTPNKAFNSMMQLVVDTDVEYTAMQFIFTPRSKHADPSQYPAYYNNILQENKYCDGRLLQLGETEQLISLSTTAFTA
jgi:hypothetical protein